MSDIICSCWIQVFLTNNILLASSMCVIRIYDNLVLILGLTNTNFKLLGVKNTLAIRHTTKNKQLKRFYRPLAKIKTPIRQLHKVGNFNSYAFAADVIIIY